MDLTDILVERSGDLKHQILDFAQKPRFERAFRQEIRQRFGRTVVAEDEDLTNFHDWFIQEYRLVDGRTIVDRFLETHSDLPSTERDFLLGWRRVREGIYEVTGRDEATLHTENLIDDMPYRIRTNVGPQIFDLMPPGSFLYTRVVPINDEWLMSGAPRLFPAAARDDVLTAATRIASVRPDLVFHNPDRVQRGWELQRAQHAAFVAHFGSDEMTVAADDVPSVMREFWTAFSNGATDGPPTDVSWLHDAVESVGIIYDETSGLGMYADYAMAQEAFADPGLMRRQRYKELIKAYVEDESVDPVPLQRLATRHPDNANAVLRAALGKPGFRWETDNEQLLRQRKSSWHARAHLPKVTVLGDRLASRLRRDEDDVPRA